MASFNIGKIRVRMGKVNFKEAREGKGEKRKKKSTVKFQYTEN